MAEIKPFFFIGMQSCSGLKIKMEIKYQSAEDAVKIIKSGNRVFVHGSAATPLNLLKALLNRSGELKNVELVSITTLGDDIFNHPDFE